MADWLREYGWLGSKAFCLVEENLGAHTIEFENIGTPNQYIRFSPPNVTVSAQFMAALAPHWIWNPHAVHFLAAMSFNEFEWENLEPRHKGLEQLKYMFERTAGPGYACLASQRGYKIARRLEWLVLSEHPREVVIGIGGEVLQRWKMLREKKEQGTDGQSSERQGAGARPTLEKRIRQGTPRTMDSDCRVTEGLIGRWKGLDRKKE